MVTTEIKSTHNRSRKPRGASFFLTAWSRGEFSQMQSLGVITPDKKIELLVSAVPPKQGGRKAYPIHPEKVELAEGEKLCRVTVVKAYGLVRFILGPVKGPSMKSMAACPPLAATSNPTAAHMLGRFIGRKVMPDLAIVCSLREAVPAEASLLFDQPEARGDMRNLPPPVREALLGLDRMVADIRGVSVVTQEPIAEPVPPEAQLEAADEDAIQDLAAVLGNKFHIGA